MRKPFAQTVDRLPAQPESAPGLRTSEFRPEKRGREKQVRRLLADKLGKRFSYQRIPANGFCASAPSAQVMPPEAQQETESVTVKSCAAEVQQRAPGTDIAALARVWRHGHIGKCFQSEPFQL
jgi:hypothetical protein